MRNQLIPFVNTSKVVKPEMPSIICNRVEIRSPHPQAIVQNRKRASGRAFMKVFFDASLKNFDTTFSNLNSLQFEVFDPETQSDGLQKLTLEYLKTTKGSLESRGKKRFPVSGFSLETRLRITFWSTYWSKTKKHQKVSRISSRQLNQEFPILVSVWSF